MPAPPRAILPIGLDLTDARLAVVGRGRHALNRLELLRRFELEPTCVWSDAPLPELVAVAGARLRHGLPDAADIEGLAVLFVGDLPEETAAPLAQAARQAGVLVNVEDIPPLCDFHVPAVVRRGDLTLTVSTRGQAPGLAGQIRRRLEAQFDPAWARRIREVAALRQTLHRQGAPPPDVARQVAAHVEAQGWLQDSCAEPTHQPQR
jgi:precorrin-2 dehydrogenase / sirohydrochlorin ferrochelatase